MKLELKAIKHTEWASQETHCYQASLYVNGNAITAQVSQGLIETYIEEGRN